MPQLFVGDDADAAIGCSNPLRSRAPFVQSRRTLQENGERRCEDLALNPKHDRGFSVVLFQALWTEVTEVYIARLQLFVD